MQLRPYQLEMQNALRVELRSHRSTCAVLPTGGGKTVIFSSISAGAVSRGKTIWIGVHREELIEQTSSKLREFGIGHGVIQGGRPQINSQVQIVMVQSARARLQRLQMPDLLIIDECHHAPAGTYKAIMEALPPASKIIGFTATPERLDGKGLGHHFETMVEGPKVSELITMGYLVPPVVYRVESVDTSALHTRMGDFDKAEAEALMDRSAITGDIVEHYTKHANGLAAVAFCVSVAHAEHLAEAFCAAGIPAISVDGSLPKDVRKNRLNAFRDGTIKVVTNCDLISEGFDLPRLECCILARPTKSLAMYLQQVGRALRTDEARGKSRAIILDHVGNSHRLGLPAKDRIWSLEGRSPRKKKEEEEENELNVKTCENCFKSYVEKICPYCGFVPEKGPGREIAQVDGELVEVKESRKYVSQAEYQLLTTATDLEMLMLFCGQIGIEFMVGKNVLTQRASSLHELERLEKVLEYKSGWAHHKYRARHGNEGLQAALAARRQAAANGDWRRVV